jgi:hypothetical protein
LVYAQNGKEEEKVVSNTCMHVHQLGILLVD